jgi:hypothetical protein
MKKYGFLLWAAATLILTVLAVFMAPILLIIERTRDEKERQRTTGQGMGGKLLS